MSKIYTNLALIILLCVVTTNSSCVHLDDKHTISPEKNKSESNERKSLESISSQLELIQCSLENLGLKEKLLEEEISESRNLLLKSLTDLKEHLTENKRQTENVEPIGKANNSHDSVENSKIQNTIKPMQNQNELNKEFKENVTASLEILTKHYGNITNSLSNIEQTLRKENSTNISKYHDDQLNCLENCNSSYGLPTNCADNIHEYVYSDGANVLNISTSLFNFKPFYAYCVREKGQRPAWTVIQRREDGSENFNRNWYDYKHGFGNVYGEYWIGLERLHAMTSNQTYELWVLLKDYDGEKRYAKYSEFYIGSESEGYEISLGQYSGDAGDSLRHHRNKKFSTFDMDNDRSFLNCAQSFKSGWWYVSCYNCNLNGVYHSASNKNTIYGINWNTFKGHQESMKFAQMAIRPVQK